MQMTTLATFWLSNSSNNLLAQPTQLRHMHYTQAQNDRILKLSTFSPQLFIAKILLRRL